MFILYVFISILIVLDVPVEIITQTINTQHAILVKQLYLLIEGKQFILFYKIILGVLLFGNTFIYNQLLISIKLFKVKNYFIGFIFLILIGFATVNYDCLPVLFASFFILLSFKIIFNTLRKSNAIFDYFNVGLLFSLAFLFWETALFYTVIIFISILIFRIQNWREWVVAFMGFFLPVFITSSIYFFVYSNFDIIFDTYQLFLNKVSLPEINVRQFIVIVFVLLLSLFSIMKILAKFNSIESNVQDYYKTFSILFLISLIVSFLIPSNIYSNYLIGIIGLNIVFSSSFIFIKNNIISEVLFDIFLIMSIFLYIL